MSVNDNKTTTAATSQNLTTPMCVSSYHPYTPLLPASSSTSVTTSTTCNGAAFLQKSASHLKACFSRYPTLEEILNNSAPYPYNLTAFIAFLSQNHCLETVEFLMDVAKYTDYCQSGSSTPNDMLIFMWKRIVDTYIRPEGPKQLNLPCDVRTKITSMSVQEPPSHAALSHAVDLVKEMIKENAYLQFISSVKCSSTATASPSNQTATTHSCLLNFGLLSPLEPNVSQDSVKSDCSWHQPDSWNSDCLSKSSSSESLYTGDEDRGIYCRELVTGGGGSGSEDNPITPPESPCGFTSRSCVDIVPPVNRLSYQSVSSSGNGDLCKSPSLSQQALSETGASIPRHHSHWRKMSQRLKWRRSSDKEQLSSSSSH